MKYIEKTEKLIKNYGVHKNSTVKTTAELDERILKDAFVVFQKSKQTISAELRPTLWRLIMKSRISKLATAALVIIGLSIVFTGLFTNGAKPAYAIEQTLEAIRQIKTVYMAGEFYKQGEFECWMQYDSNPDKPAYIWLGNLQIDSPLCKICSPDGVFLLNRHTRRVFYASRDERDKNWYVNFGKFFEDIVKKAVQTDSIEIHPETTDMNKEVIVVTITSEKRQQQFRVDPETKLPLSFTTLRENDYMEMARNTLAVKNLFEIRYNEEPPAGLFDMPEDAVVVEEEIDCIVHPGMGMPADDMTAEEACLQLVKKVIQATNQFDYKTVQNLRFPAPIPPDEILEAMKAQLGNQPLIELIKHGNPYQHGDMWYLPVTLLEGGRKTKKEDIPIKFYEFDGKSYCIIAYED
ncbi:MAG: hypothetical protein JW860_11950 [Sedimentisphaerales bacterium]|nr:hypothetical protein [Sedimentisphaerales bacterium]